MTSRNRFQHRLPFRCCGFATATLLLAGGCQHYEAKPLELSSHREAFLARTGEPGSLLAFVEQLGPQPSSAAAFNLDDGITLDEASAVALVFNAELRLARLRAGVAQANAQNAGLWQDPTIGVDLTRIIQSVEHPWKLAASVGLTIPISGRLEIEKERAGLEHTTELMRVHELEWRTRIDLERAWVTLSAAETELATTRAYAERLDGVVEIVDRMESIGELVRTEARLFRIERAQQLAELSELEERASAARLAVLELMGLSPRAQVRLVGLSPSVSADSASIASDPAGAEALLSERNPAMLTATARYEVAEKTLELRVREQYPDLNIGPGYGREDGNDEVLLGLSVPLPILNGNRREIAEARAQRELAREEAQTTLERLLAEWESARLALTAARSRRNLLQHELVPLVESQFADARKLAELGEVNTLVMLESLNGQREARSRLIRAVLDESLAELRVRELLGPEEPVSASKETSKTADEAAKSVEEVKQ